MLTYTELAENCPCTINHAIVHIKNAQECLYDTAQSAHELATAVLILSTVQNKYDKEIENGEN